MANALIHYVGAIIKRVLTWASNDMATLTVTLNGTPVPSGSKVRKGKTLSVVATPQTGYQDAAAYANGSLVSNETYVMGKVNTEITVDAIPTNYSLTTSNVSQYNPVTINRTAVGGPGGRAGASTKNGMTSSDHVYYGDRLSFTQSPNTGFKGTYTVTNAGATVVDKQTDAKTTDVNGDIAVSSAVTPTAYSVTTSGINANNPVTIKRTGRGDPGTVAGVGTNDTITSSSKVYYNDTLTFTQAPKAGYSGTWSASGVSNNKVTGNVTVTSSATKVMHLVWLTTIRTGYRRYTTSGSWYYRCSTDCPYTTGSGSSAQTIANVSGNQLTVYAYKSGAAGGNSTAGTGGVAMKLSGDKMSITNGQTITARWTSQSNGTSNFAGNDIYIAYCSSVPATGNTSPFSGVTLLGEGRASAGSLSVKFTGATGSYYIGVAMEGDYEDTSYNSTDAYHLGGQITLSSIAIS